MDGLLLSKGGRKLGGIKRNVWVSSCFLSLENFNSNYCFGSLLLIWGLGISVRCAMLLIFVLALLFCPSLTEEEGQEA